MKLLIILATTFLVTSAQFNRFGSRSIFNDSPEDDSRESRENTFRGGGRFGGRSNTNFFRGSNRRSNSRDDSRENFFRIGTGGTTRNRQRDSPEDSFGTSNFGGSGRRFGNSRNAFRRRDSDEDSFENRRNPFRSSFGGTRRRFDDSDEIFGRTNSFNRARQGFTGRTSFNRIDDSDEVFSGRTSFNRLDSASDEVFGRPRTRTSFGNVRNTFSTRTNFGTPRRTTPVRQPVVTQPRPVVTRPRTVISQPRTVSQPRPVVNHFSTRPRTFSVVRDDSPEDFRGNDIDDSIEINFRGNRIEIDDSRENFGRSRPTFRLDDSIEDDISIRTNRFRSPFSNRFSISVEDDSDENINSIFAPRTSLTPSQPRTNHFANRNVFNTRTSGRRLPGLSFNQPQSPGTFHFTTPVGRTSFTTPTRKPNVGSFNFNTPVGKPLPKPFTPAKKPAPPKKPAFPKKTAFPKKVGRTNTGVSLPQFNQIRSNPFSTSRKAGSTGFVWPGDNVSGYYVSMSTNNQPATSYFVHLDD